MKQTSTLFFSLLFLTLRAQLFNGTGGAILNNGVNTYFNLNVSGLSQTQLDSTFGVEEVCININHPTNQELYIYLQSPSGTIVELTEGSSCTDTNYTNTCFKDTAASSITIGQAPYTGSFKPVGYLGRFNNGQTGNGTWKLIVKDYLAFINSGNLASWSIRFGNSPSPNLKFTSSNLPIVIINTSNQSISDTSIIANMGIIYNGSSQRNNTTNTWNHYNGKIKIHLRGNSSKNFEKKPYNLETKDATGNDLNVSLLGMPPESDWCLIAAYQDKSLIRIPLAYDLFGRMGHYTPKYKFVEVVINDEYRGVYILVEKPKRGPSRINVSKLTKNDNTNPNITGGYIFKIDRADEGGWYSLLPGNSQNNSHFYYEYVYPKDTDITIQQEAYIKNYMNSFETIMASSSFSDQTNGYPKYIETNSFVDFFLINELSKNVDAYRLSTYLYKDNISNGGKLHIGPVWDYDLAWHNCNYGDSFLPSGWEYQMADSVFPCPTWWDRFKQDTNFVNQVYCRWTQLRQGILKLNNLNSYIDSTALVLNESQQRNFIQWPILGAYIFPNPQNQSNATYQTEVSDLKTWVANRIAWMDASISGNCIMPFVVNNHLENKVHIYPNPFESSTTFSIHLIKDGDVSLKIIDPLGKELSQLVNEHKSVGEFNLTFDRNQLPSGIYFYQLTVDNDVTTGKLVIQ